MNTTTAFGEAPLHARTDAEIPAMQRLYWSVRRELWENRSLYLAPLAVGALIVVGYAIGLAHLPDKIRAASALDAMQQHEALEQPYTFASLLLMFTTIVVGLFYCLDTLQGERRDRSMLFWKSLPVSDATTVLAKACIVFVILPLLGFVITVATQFDMVLLASGRLMGTGLSVWSHLSLGHMWALLFVHLILGHGLWFAPFWGWLLLCSAWSRRVPYLWATLPLLAVGVVEKIAFNTSHFGHWLAYRFGGGPWDHPQAMASGKHPMTMAAMTPSVAEFFTTPGFWFGLALAAGFVAAAIRLRRSQGPI